MHRGRRPVAPGYPAARNDAWKTGAMPWRDRPGRSDGANGSGTVVRGGMARRAEQGADSGLGCGPAGRGAGLPAWEDAGRKDRRIGGHWSARSAGPAKPSATVTPAWRPTHRSNRPMGWADRPGRPRAPDHRARRGGRGCGAVSGGGVGHLEHRWIRPLAGNVAAHGAAASGPVGSRRAAAPGPAWSARAVSPASRSDRGSAVCLGPPACPDSAGPRACRGDRWGHLPAGDGPVRAPPFSPPGRLSDRAGAPGGRALGATARKWSYWSQ